MALILPSGQTSGEAGGMSFLGFVEALNKIANDPTVQDYKNIPIWFSVEESNKNNEEIGIFRTDKGLCVVMRVSRRVRI